jgi:hypothetical protein
MMSRHMLRFLFGDGWGVVTYLFFYFAVVVGILLPSFAFRPLKPYGQKPDTPSLGSFGFVFCMAFFMLLATVIAADDGVDLFIASWFKRRVLMLAAATLAGVVVFLTGAHLAQCQRVHAFWLHLLVVVALAGGNLWLMHLARTRGPSVLLPTWAMVLATVAATPALLAIALAVGAMLLRLIKRR